MHESRSPFLHVDSGLIQVVLEEGLLLDLAEHIHIFFKIL